MEGAVTMMKVDDPGGRSENEELLLNDLYIDPIGYQVKMGPKCWRSRSVTAFNLTLMSEYIA
jgi:hypothetical protein